MYIKKVMHRYLSYCEEKALESSKVSDQLKDPKDLGDAYQPHHLASLANDVELGEVVHNEGDEVGQNGKEIDQVHGLDEELELLGRADEANKVLDGEVDGREVVDVEDDGGGGAALGVLQHLVRFVFENVKLGICAEKRGETNVFGSDCAAFLRVASSISEKVEKNDRNKKIR